jgi:hypothetical protein
MEAVVADFDPAQLAKLRRIGAEIRTADRPGVRSAIALAGSAAQSRFQLFPGDCDFFERVHIDAPTRDEAIATLAATMIQTVAHVFPHPELQFAELKLGLHRADGMHGDKVVRSGAPISWELGDLDARTMTIERPDGTAEVIELVASATEPGFVKLDWVFADAEADRIVAVSKVIDATWGAPDGSIVALDGVLDSFYQEVYLDPETRPHVERLIDELKPDGLEHYIDQLHGEISKYTEPGHENYGKVAKRLYNIFRITHRTEAAAYLRGLFDDPPARLYQLSAALWALSNTFGTKRLSAEVLQAQLQGLADTLRDCYMGADVDELVASVLSLPDLPAGERQVASDRVTNAADVQVSDYFKAKLAELPEIQAYLADMGEG